MKVPAFITKLRERRAQRRWEFEKPLRLQQADKARTPSKASRAASSAAVSTAAAAAATSAAAATANCRTTHEIPAQAFAGGLENRQGASPRGFESHPRRPLYQAIFGSTKPFGRAHESPDGTYPVAAQDRSKPLLTGAHWRAAGSRRPGRRLKEPRGVGIPRRPTRPRSRQAPPGAARVNLLRAH